MSAEGRAEMRQIAERMFSAYLRQVEERHSGAVTIPQLRSVLATYFASPAFHTVLHQAHGRLLQAAALELLRQQRGDPFQRMVVHPLAEAFQDGRLARDLLPSYFSFLHLVLGDARDKFTAQCADILAELRDPDPLGFSWDSFYEDPRTKLILWSVLVRIAETFRRFEVRREWFIGLMQNRPHSVSLGSHAFQPRPRSDDGREAKQFDTEEFAILFGALFSPLRQLPPRDQATFQRSFGAMPDEVLGHLFANLDAQAT